MYPEGDYTVVYENDLSIIFTDCSDWRTCPKGIIDYACQFENMCIIQLIEFGIMILVTFLGASLFIAISGKLISLMYSLLTSVLFVHKIADCLTGCLKCLSFGLFSSDGKTQVEIVEPDKMSKKKEKLSKKMAEIDVQLNFEALDRFQIAKVEHILENY